MAPIAGIPDRLALFVHTTRYRSKKQETVSSLPNELFSVVQTVVWSHKATKLMNEHHPSENHVDHGGQAVSGDRSTGLVLPIDIHCSRG